MEFSSQVPLFLDPSPTWHQQETSNQLQLRPQLQLQPSVIGTNGSGQSSTRPGSMVDRARQAQLPLPEPGLNCPRCDSTNTKFCYFNNYNLSQPRHFCKACRRYWTRGGALRNVPVGGGCRRNNKKRNKARSKTGSKPDQVSTQVSLPPPQPDPFLNGFGNGFGLNLGGGEQLYGDPFSGGLLPNQASSGLGHQGLNLSNIGGDYSSWRGGISSWTDISGFHGSSSSNGHLL